MRLTDYEIQEWHEYVLRQRDRYKRVLEDIAIGVPTVRGMASSYRRLTLKEIEQIARDTLVSEKQT